MKPLRALVYDLNNGIAILYVKNLNTSEKYSSSIESPDKVFTSITTQIDLPYLDLSDINDVLGYRRPDGRLEFGKNAVYIINDEEGDRLIKLCTSRYREYIIKETAVLEEQKKEAEIEMGYSECMLNGMSGYTPKYYTQDEYIRIKRRIWENKIILYNLK